MTTTTESIVGGTLSIKNQGAQSEARFYCEVNNAHYTALKAQPHALFSGNPVVLLPAYDLDFSKPNFQAHITASGNVSSSAISTASFGTYLGDGSQLSGISTTPFPFTGDAVITGSLTVSGSNNRIDGSTVIFSTGTPGLTVQSNSDTAEEVKIFDAKIDVEDSGYMAARLSSNAYGNRIGILDLRHWAGNSGAVITAAPSHTSYIQSSLLIGKTGTVNSSHTYKLDVDGDVKLGNGTDDSIEIFGPVTASSDISSSASSTASFGTYLGDGSQLTGISSGTNFTQSLFVTPTGNDSTATIGNMSKPFHTILAATASANIGDSIIIYPGTYPSESANIIKDGVNYYFYPGAIVHPTSSLTEYVVDIEDPVHPINVRGHGTFISDDTTYGAIRIQAKECYFEFDTAKTTNNTTNTFNQGGTVNLEPTNADSGRSSTNNIKGNPFYVNGKIVNTGNFGTYGGALVLGRSGVTDYSSLIFEGSVMQLHPTDASPAISVRSDKTTYDFSVNANVFASASQAVYSIGRGAVRLRGIYSTGDRNNKYAIELTDGYRTYYDIDAHINGAVKLNTGANTNSGGILRGTILTSGTPDDAAIYINGGGQHKIDNQIFMRDSGGFGIKIDTDPAQVEFTGDFNADANSSYINFCKVTTGKLIFKGSLGSSVNRGYGNIINGGHLVIDSFFDNDGSNYPSNSYCFQLSAGTLEINNKVTHAYNTTGSGIVDMTGGYLKLNGAELVQLNGTGSFAYCIDLNGGAHSGSILNNSFTNVNPFGPGSFTNEIVGGGTLFETDKLY